MMLEFFALNRNVSASSFHEMFDNALGVRNFVALFLQAWYLLKMQSGGGTLCTPDRLVNLHIISTIIKFFTIHSALSQLG